MFGFGILRGLTVTLKRFWMPKITEKYPEVQPALPPLRPPNRPQPRW